MCGGRRAYLVLDVDDTLVATFLVGWRKCVHVAEVMRLPAPDRSLFTRLYGTMSFEECVARLHPRVDLAEYARCYDTLVEQFPAEPMGDVSGFVAAARRAGFGVGVFTNGPGAKTVRKLAAVGLSTGDFDFVRDAETSRVLKPAPAAFQDAVDDYAICPRCSWYASDQPADWKGAAAAGLRTIGILSGAPDPASIGLLPVIIAPSLASLIGCLTEMRGRDPHAPAAYDSASIRAVSLDAGFTLITDVRSPRELIGEIVPTDAPVDDVLAQCAYLLDDGHHRWQSDAAIGAHLHGYYSAVLTKLGRPDTVAAEVIEAYTKPANWRAIIGATELLTFLEGRELRTVVLSNWQSNLGEVLAHTGIRVGAAISSASAGVAKPDPAALAIAAAAANVALDELLHCGDNAYADVGVALRAGRPSILMESPDSPATRSALRMLQAPAVPSHPDDGSSAAHHHRGRAGWQGYGDHAASG